jgi:hypothetical protein
VRSKTLSITAGLALVFALVATAASAQSGSSGASPPADDQLAGTDQRLACAGGNGDIQHVIYVQFDNTHLLRDRPGVPSDLEQMPNLLNFMRSNGALLSNDHTVLISHTGGGILSSITGVYPDRHGQAVSNSFRYYKPDGTTGLGVSFAYWNAGIFDPTTTTPTDTSFNMIAEDGRNAPAPWVPYTRAGCDVGAVATANTVLENTALDVPVVFGADSDEAAEAAANPKLAQADFVGIAVHCSQTDTVCDDSQNARPDPLPDEPGGYDGFSGLFGAKYVDPVLDPSGDLTDLDGNVIADPAGNPGFPGFDGMSASVTLSWVAAMQESGIPVTYAYISDAHDLHPPDPIANTIGHVAQGPGEAGYVQQLHDYDQAFGAFFDRLAADGITRDNTLFVFTVEEGDHFVGGEPANAGCDGVTTPCEWAHVTCSVDCPANAVGEINVNLRGLLATQRSNTTAFDVHSDMAPAFYLIGNPAQDDPITRTFERDVGALTASDPLTGATDQLSLQMIDRTGMDLLHMVTADPLRTPTFVSFLDPDYFGFGGASNCSLPCSTVQPGFAWNHGGLVPEVATTWVGFVGPGIRNLGETDAIWSDHTDLRPTMLRLLGLEDDYVSDGRVLTEMVKPVSLPLSLQTNGATFRRLARVYKQINAPFGIVGLNAIDVSTGALNGDDATYSHLEDELAELNVDRDALASQMTQVLNGAAFDDQFIRVGKAKRLIRAGQELIARAQALAEEAGA